MSSPLLHLCGGGQRVGLGDATEPKSTVGRWMAALQASERAHELADREISDLERDGLAVVRGSTTTSQPSVKSLPGARPTTGRPLLAGREYRAERGSSLLDLPVTSHRPAGAGASRPRRCLA